MWSWAVHDFTVQDIQLAVTNCWLTWIIKFQNMKFRLNCIKYDPITFLLLSMCIVRVSMPQALLRTLTTSPSNTTNAFIACFRIQRVTDACDFPSTALFVVMFSHASWANLIWYKFRLEPCKMSFPFEFVENFPCAEHLRDRESKRKIWWDPILACSHILASKN